MSKAQRDKGLRGELEVKHAFALAAFAVRGLEGLGDWLAMKPGVTLHVETKRRETIRIEEWCRQAEAEAPQGVPAVVCWRRSRQPWRATMLLDDLLVLLTRDDG